MEQTKRKLKRQGTAEERVEELLCLLGLLSESCKHAVSLFVTLDCTRAELHGPLLPKCPTTFFLNVCFS